MKIHDLKCWPANFEAAKAGRKTVELRNNDRNFRVGEMLRLRRWDAIEGYDESEPPLYREITHINLGPAHGLSLGYAALSVKPAEAPVEPIAIHDFGRCGTVDRAISITFTRRPTEQELDSLEAWLREWRFA